MPRIALADIASGYLSTEQLNAVLNYLEVVFDNVVFRDGQAPNAMQADLDLGGHKIINTGLDPNDPNALTTFAKVVEYVNQVGSGLVVQRYERIIAIASQTVFNLTNITFQKGANNIAVYVNGVRKFLGYDFVETDGDTITFLSGLTVGDKVDFFSNDYVSTVSFIAHQHAWGDVLSPPVYTTRWPTYAEVTGKPASFTPAFHVHDGTDITTGRIADAQRRVYVQSTQPVGLGAPDAGALWFW